MLNLKWLPVVALLPLFLGLTSAHAVSFRVQNGYDQNSRIGVYFTVMGNKVICSIDRANKSNPLPAQSIFNCPATLIGQRVSFTAEKFANKTDTIACNSYFTIPKDKNTLLIIGYQNKDECFLSVVN